MVQLEQAGASQCLIWQGSLSDADDQEHERALAQAKKRLSGELMALTTNVALSKTALSSTYE